MVLESVVAYYLNKYLFNYVENLDSNQLKIGIWGGDIVLNNLRIRENALDDLDLPLQLVYGHLGKFVLKIPWKSLYSQAVVAQIEDLFLLIAPKQSVPYDEEKEQQNQLYTKQMALKALDDAYQQELEKDNKADPTYVEKLVARVINNIQVKIANVHIRYEHSSFIQRPFAFGLTLYEFEIFTTDDNWQKCFVDGVIRHVYKLANLDCFSVYMNCNSESYSTKASNEIIELFRKNIANKLDIPEGYSFVLGPISLVAKLLLNSDPNRDSPPFTIPKTDLKLEMEKLNVGLTSTQFQITMGLLDDMNNFSLAVPYRKYRPFNKTYKGNAKLWWEFAITSVLEEQVRKRTRSNTWEHIKEHRQLCRIYAEAHKERSLSKKPSATLEETCALAEQKLDLFNLMLIRKRIQMEVDRVRKEEETKRGTRSSWFGGWFGGGNKTNDDKNPDLATSIQAAMTPEEKNKLHMAIGYEDNMAPLQLPENFEAVHMNFILQSLEIGLYDDESKAYEKQSMDWHSLQTIMLLQLKNMACTVKQRPAASALSVCVGMKELLLTGYEHENVVPTIVKSKISQKSNLLDIFFETNPLDKLCDQRIKVSARPLQIVYDAETIVKLMKVFAPKQQVNLSELEGAATLKISNFKERSATGMQYMIESHAILDIDLKFMPTIVILPQGGIYDPSNKSMVVVGLGELSITSAPSRQQSYDVSSMFHSGKEQDEILQSVMNKAYDNYQVSIENMQVMVVKPKEDWEVIMKKMIESEMHLLRPTTVHIKAKVCVVDDDPRLPKAKVEVLLPSIKLCLVEDRIYEALSVGLSIPLPEKEEPEVIVNTNLVRTFSSAAIMRSMPQYLNQDERRKTLANSALTTEVVQYTSLELSFALKEFSVVVSRNRPAGSLSPFSKESSLEFKTPSQESTGSETDIEYVDTQSTITALGADLQKLLAFHVLQLEVSVAQRTFEMVAEASLGAIGLFTYEEHRAYNDLGIAVIETPGFTQDGKALLNVKFTTVNKTTPDFTTKYKSIEQLAQINFATLNVILHQESILYAMTVADQFQRKIENIMLNAGIAQQVNARPKDRIASTTSGEGIITRLTRIAEENEFSNVTPTGSPKPVRKTRTTIKQAVVESIKMKIEANLEQVGLELTCKKRSLASLKINHLYAGVVLKSSYTEVQVGLKDILLIDMNPVNIHTNILSVVGKEALNLNVVIYNLDETSAYNSDDMKINAEIGCLKIVFINWFVTSVLSFMSHFQAAQQAIANASAAAADAAKQNAVAAYEKATRMKLNVKVKAPVIIVPIDSKSLDAFVLDLGQLTLSNVITDIETPNKGKGPAVLDEIKLVLKDMRMVRVFILEETHQYQSHSSDLHSMDVLDSNYGFKSRMNILDPITFTLAVKRNLSFSWYKNLPEIDISGRLRCIELNLFKDDYGLIMAVLNRNMIEGAKEFPSVVSPPPPPQVVTAASESLPRTPGDSPTKKAANLMKTKMKLKKIEDEKITEHFKFNFQFDGVVINLMTNGDEGLARFGLYVLSLRGTKLLNETLTTNIVLCNMQLEDTRPSNSCEIKTYLCRKVLLNEAMNKNSGSPLCTQTANKQISEDTNYMLDVTAVIKQNDTVANVRVSSFDLILCVDFLLQLTDYIKTPLLGEFEEIVSMEDVSVQQDPLQLQQGQIRSIASATVAARQISQKEADEVEKNVSKVNLNLIIEEPDIILVESLTDMNTSAIIFNMGVNLSYRSINEKQLIKGNVENLKMFMCTFAPEKRASTQHFILHPCAINLQGSTPENDGMNISLTTSDILINISPATLELFNKAMKSVTPSQPDSCIMKVVKDYSDIWTAKSFKEKDYWFLRADQAEDALAALEPMESNEASVVPTTECCVIEVPSFTVILEAGIGIYTTPLISMDMSINAIANNWSSSLSVSGTLTLSMNYYNETLAMWEPVIEQNERTLKDGEHTYAPWELNFNLDIEKTISEFEEGKEETRNSIKIHSDENLEMTVSKTLLDLITQLSESFGQAMDAEGLTKPEIESPYDIQNDTGFDLNLDFTRGTFTLHETHMPNENGINNHSIVFQSIQGPTVSPKSIKCCTISPGCKAYLRTNVVDSEMNEDVYNLYATIGNIGKELVLPVSKSDQRYFSLYRDINQDPWGIVSEVNSQYGTTHINIHSVLNIKNHFTTAVKVYRMIHKTKEMIEVGVVAPGKLYHVPLHAVYSEGKYLHFGIDDYHTSVQGIKWDDCPTDMNYIRLLQCDPIETFEPFFINVSREKTEIYHEHTNKFKLMSAYYTLHLRPPVYLRNTLPINITVSVAGCSVRQKTASATVQTEESLSSSSDDVNKGSLTHIDTYVKEDLLDYGEKDVEAGSFLQLPTVKLAGRSKVVKSFLVVRLIQYLERDWSCTTEISENKTGVMNWRFSSYDSDAKMSMDLCVKYENQHGSLFITIFSPFWLINKTSQMLSYKTDSENVEVLYHPPEYNGPILFSMRDKYMFDKKTCTIRVENGEWSNKIPLDVAGSTGSVACKTNDQIFQIGVHNHLTQNTLTKQITFIPFYTITNKCSYEIEVQEHTRPADPWHSLEPNQCSPIWPRNDSDHMLVAKVDGQRTVPFKYTDPTCYLLQLNMSKYGGINVDIQATEGGIYITFTEYNPGDAPGLLINHTDYPLYYHEKGVNTKMVLQPHQKLLYTWCDPAGDKMLVCGENFVENDLRRDGFGKIRISHDCNACYVSFLNGLQRVLLFTQCQDIATKSETSNTLQSITQSIEIKIHGIGLSLINNETGVDILYLGITSTGVIWETRKSEKKRFKLFSLHETALMEAAYQQYLLDKTVSQHIGKCYMLDGKYQIDFEHGTMLKKCTAREIKRQFQPGVWVELNTSPFQSQIHAKINHIQLDNQLTDCIFPVVLAPIPPPKTLAKTIQFKPFVEVSIVERVVPHSTVKQYKYARVLMQEFHFKVDLIFLMAIAELFASSVDEEHEAKLFKEDVASIEKPLCDLVHFHSQQQQKNFYDNLHLGPMKVHVSFSMAGVDTSALPGVLSDLMQGVGVTLTDVNDVVIRLAFFEREYQFYTQDQLKTEIISHYTGQALKQVYVLILGLDVLGNPYGLVIGIKKGVEDLFYEPFQGAIQGPGEFAEGLVLGVKSLLGHTVGGAAGAVSKITGAVGKGLAALTFDDEYQKKRRQAMNAKPKSFQEGMARSGKGLVMGFVDGVTGCVTKPITGAKEQGVEGFFKGLGKGTIGLVTRPTAGIVDFAHGTFDSVKRATELQGETRRLRPPRYIHDDKVLRPYCLDEAKGNQLLKEIDKGKYAATDSFIHCEEIVTKQEFAIVSNHRILYVTHNDMFGSWNVQWTYLWSEIDKVKCTDRGIEILLKKEGKKVLGLFSSGEQQHKLILMPVKKRREKLFEAIESHRHVS